MSQRKFLLLRRDHFELSRIEGASRSCNFTGKAPADCPAGAFSEEASRSCQSRWSPINGLPGGEHRIAHGVCPEFPVLLDLFRRLFHVPALLVACGCLYRSVLVPSSGKHMGSYHMPPCRNALIPFSILPAFFMSSPRPDTSCFFLPAAFRRVNGEAHRVGPVLLIGLHVPGFLFHGRVSFPKPHGLCSLSLSSIYSFFTF